MKRILVVLSLISHLHVFSMNEPVPVEIINQGLKTLTLFYQKKDADFVSLDLYQNQRHKIFVPLGEVVSFRVEGFKQKDLRIVDKKPIVFTPHGHSIHISQGRTPISHMKTIQGCTESYSGFGD